MFRSGVGRSTCECACFCCSHCCRRSPCRPMPCSCPQHLSYIILLRTQSQVLPLHPLATYIIPLLPIAHDHAAEANPHTRIRCVSLVSLSFSPSPLRASHPHTRSLRCRNSYQHESQCPLLTAVVTAAVTAAVAACVLHVAVKPMRNTE